ncbi:MAG TPA: hypothetical protein VEW95_03475 [Candidatus Limnocylindrales bacterium]|nr:hypothetical protein [Candidatus Limnocylindrales bacterium]
MTNHLTRSATALLAAATMLSLFAGAALAAVGGPPNENFSFAERGLTAQAYWESCAEPDASGVAQCESTQVYVFDGRQRSNDDLGRVNAALTYLCVYHQQVAIGEDGYPVGPSLIEQGCVDDPQLTVVDTLESVTAAAPVLELSQAVCTYDPETGEGSCEEGGTRSVAVEAEFTGTGDVFAQRWSSRDQSVVEGVRCTYATSGSGISREASASLALDGAALDPTFAQLSDGKTRFAQHCN